MLLQSKKPQYEYPQAIPKNPPFPTWLGLTEIIVNAVSSLEDDAVWGNITPVGNSDMFALTKTLRSGPSSIFCSCEPHL